MKRYQSGFRVFFLLTLLAAIAAGAGQSLEALPGQIRAAVVESFPPVYSTTIDNAPTGFAVDVFDRVAALAGLEVSYIVFRSWPDAIAALRDGRADVIPNIGITSERASEFAFTVPVHAFPVVLFVRSSTHDVEGIESLAGRPVAVVRMNIGEALLRDNRDIELSVYDTVHSALMELLAGHVDALVFPRPVVTRLALDAGVRDKIRTAGPPLAEVKRAMALRRGDEALLADLNNATEKFVKTGEYEKLYAKWYSEPRSIWPGREAMAAIGLVVLVMLVGMAAWRYRSVMEINRRLVASMQERKRAEHALGESERMHRHLFRSIRDVIVVADGNRTIVDANQPALRGMFGYETDELRGLSTAVLYADNAEFDRTGREVFDHLDNRVGRLLESGFRRKDGSVFPAELFAQKLIGEGGEIIGNLCVIRDITDRRQNEFRLRDSLAEKEALLKEIHHRVKNNMAIISALQSLQIDHVGDERARRMFEESRSRIASMALVHELLYEGESLSAVDVRHYVRQLAGNLIQSFGTNGTRVELHLDVDGMALDMDALIPCGLIITELVTNALKYAFLGRESGRLDIIMKRDTDGSVMLRISDNGAGIPEHAGNGNGKSLGLKIVNTLVCQLEGSIAFGTAVAGGAEITVEFKQEARA